MHSLIENSRILRVITFDHNAIYKLKNCIIVFAMNSGMSCYYVEN